MPSPTGHLTISPTTKPFKSSRLTLPPSPFSPRLPITNLHSLPPKPFRRQTHNTAFELPPSPLEPLNWLWKCHKCHRVYRLGTTRRCLDDGHFFCAGTTTTKQIRKTGGKKVVRHHACASEFDYAGWKAWGDWRRDVLEQIEDVRTLEEFLDVGNMSEMARQVEVIGQRDDFREHKDCWNTCDYPSECRWGKKHGVVTPVVVNSPGAPQVMLTMPSTSTMDSQPQDPAQAFDDMHFVMSDITYDPTDPMEGIDPTPETPITSPTSPNEDRKPSMDDLLTSVKRRKRKSAGAVPSPLASNPPSPASPCIEAVEFLASQTPSSSSSGLQRAFDDFELDLRSSIGRAGETVGTLFGVKGASSTGRWGKKRNGHGTW